MRKKKFRSPIVLFTAVVAAFSMMFVFTSCDKYPGYEKTETGLYKKLIAFGDCAPSLRDAEQFIAEIEYKSVDRADTGYKFQLHHYGLSAPQNPEDRANPIGSNLFHELEALQCGDHVSFILPFYEIKNAYISAYADTTIYDLNEQIELRIKLLRTFKNKEYADYLMQAAQQGEMDESDAIGLLLMNDPLRVFHQQHGKCYINLLHDESGDSILTGRDITIRYNTFLLNGEQLDDTTEMVFDFGRPGQIVGGLQYGLSFLQEGDEAEIYLPSFLAFGENGGSSHVVPAHTPVYFRVKVVDVKTEEEKTRKTEHN
jgi:FKBP-type peptidyl-prolyl cis-trans isomerase